MLKIVLKSLLLLVLIVVGVVMFGSVEPIDETITFKADSLDADLDAYLTKREADVPNLTPGAQKQIIWNDSATKAKTPFSIVYIHGFSATLEEVRPMPDIIAKDLGANLYFARLNGHGRDGAGLAEPSVNDWFNDTVETLAIGRAIGDKVIVVSASTGGTFSTWAATKPDLMQNIAGMVMISPNYGLAVPAASLLTMGAARQWLPIIAGEERSFEASSPDHAKWWTSSYPTVAVLPMAASLDHVNTLAFEGIAVPALFIFHKGDTVVRADLTEEVAGRWGANTAATATKLEVTEAEDKYNHVIAGRILSPSNTEPLAQKTIEWIKSL